MYYVGLDIHKRTIAYCVTTPEGTLKMQGVIPSNRKAIKDLIGEIPTRWTGAMEATIFTGWIYDEFMKYGHRLRVASPSMLKYISSGKKNDRIDARKLSDLLRCNLLPEVVMESSEIRELRMALRFRTLLVRTAVKMKNKTAGLLMESGVEYARADLRSSPRFSKFLEKLDYVPKAVVDLMRMSRDTAELFNTLQKKLVKGLVDHPELRERVKRLMSIPGVGEITALTWALEIGNPQRFSSVRKAIRYCGLCSELKESAGKQTRGPITKKRNSHLQSVLVEAAKLAPRFNPQLREVHDRELLKGNRNRATLAVARKMVAYLLSVDKNNKDFELRIRQ